MQTATAHKSFRIAYPLFRGILAVLLFSIAITTGLQDSFSQTTKKSDRPPSPAGAEAVDSAEVEQFRRSVGQFLWYRERGHKLLLDNARQQLKGGQTVDALRVLQRLIDLDEDRFIWDSARPAPTGLRQQARDELHSLDPRLFATYQTMVAGEANTLLRDAVRTGDTKPLREILRRFPFSDAAFDAGQRLAAISFERGNFEKAVLIWERLESYPPHRRRFSNAMRLQFAIAYQHLSRGNEAQQLARQLGAEQIRIAGRMTTIAKYLVDLRSDYSVNATRDWRLPQGNAARDRRVDSSTPYLQPIWRVELGGDKAGRLRNAAQTWLKEQEVRGQSTASVHTPLVVGGDIVTRDLLAVRALDKHSGQTLWTYPTSSTLLERATQPISTGGGLGSAELEGVNVGFRRGYAGNSVLQTLTSDGGRVYFVDNMRSIQLGLGRFRSPFGRRRRGDMFKPDPVWNRIVAVDLMKSVPKAGEKPAVRSARWTVGGPEKAGPADTDSLLGHCFLGPPLPLMERLYVVSEFRQQLYLICLEAATGKLVWKQRVANLEDSVASDPHRFHRSCTPAYADGLLVFPTWTGFLMAADPLSGSLRWAAFCGDEPDKLLNPEDGRSRGQAKGHVGFFSGPIIHSGRVFMLSPNSDHIRSFSLQTGRALWAIPREDAEFLAAVDDATVLVVGRRYARGLSFTDGKPLWSTHTGTPSGRGFANRLHYMLPLESGRVITIERLTGRIIGFGLAATSGEPAGSGASWRPGNLVAVGDVLLSAETGQIRAFPSARRQFVDVLRRVKSEKYTLNDLRTGAELALLLGEIDDAERMLSVGLSRLKTAPLPDLRKQQATRLAMETLMRELLYVRLSRRQEAAKTLAQLDRLSKTPEERGRLLLSRAEYFLECRNAAALLKTIDELAELDLDGLFPLPRSESHLVSVSAWVPMLLRRARKQITGEIPLELDRRKTLALAAKDNAGLERFLRVFGAFPQAEPVRSELAARMIKAGEFQRAELLILANRSSAAPQTAAIASRQLFELCTAHGLHNRAVKELRELSGRFAEHVVSDDSTTGRQFAESALRDPRTKAARGRAVGPQRPVKRVSIRETRWLDGNDELLKMYGEFRQIFPTPDDSPFDLLDLGQTVNTELTVVHRDTGTVAGRVRIPSRHSYPLMSQESHIGQFSTLGSSGRMHGLSLLEADRGKALWTARPHGFGQRDDVLLVGPAGPTYAIFQARELLVAVDPGTGRLLWQRNDIPATDGLQSDPYSGLFGDANLLVMFSEDRSNYTTYDTKTGELRGRGSLPVSDQYERRLFGRRLFYVSDDGKNKRFRIWDPVAGRHILDRPFEGPLFTTTTAENELAALHSDGKLDVIDVTTGIVRQTIQFHESEMKNVTYLKAFREGDRLIVNIQRPVSVSDRFFSFYAGDTFGPAEHIRGELYSYSLQSGKRLWKRTIPQRTVLRPRIERLPFLVLVSRIRDRTRGTRAALLIEIVDIATGRTLGIRNDLLPDRILHLRYDAEHNNVEIRGTNSIIRLELREKRIHGSTDPVKL